MDYGSGAVAEIFSAHLVEGYEQMLHPNRMAELDQRKALTIAEYEKIFFEEAQLDAEAIKPSKVTKIKPLPYQKSTNTNEPM